MTAKRMSDENYAIAESYVNGIGALHQSPPFSVGDSGIVYDEGGLEFALPYGGGAEGFANAAFIVRACNAHASLLAALITVRDYWAGGDAPEEITRQIHDAINQAEAKS